MATTTTTPTKPPARNALRLRPPSGQAARPKLSWVFLGLTLVVIAALVGAITVARVADREPVLALAQPLERGEALTAAHLTVVDVATDAEVGMVPEADRGEVIGLLATANLPAGTLVTRGLFTAGTTLTAGASVVGLALQPGEYPTSVLRPGDLVTVIRTPDPVGAGAVTEAAVLVERVEVYAVEPLSETSRSLMVSVVVPEGVAPAVAAAASQGRVRLVLVSAR